MSDVDKFDQVSHSDWDGGRPVKPVSYTKIGEDPFLTLETKNHKAPASINISMAIPQNPSHKHLAHSLPSQAHLLLVKSLDTPKFDFLI